MVVLIVKLDLLMKAGGASLDVRPANA